MPDREKTIKGLEKLREDLGYGLPDRSNVVMGYLNSLTDALALLKEQEPKTGHWIFESQYCEAWSHKCSECGKRMTTAVGMYANYCWNCGAKMEGR